MSEFSMEVMWKKTIEYDINSDLSRNNYGHGEAMKNTFIYTPMYNTIVRNWRTNEENLQDQINPSGEKMAKNVVGCGWAQRD